MAVEVYFIYVFVLIFIHLHSFINVTCQKNARTYIIYGNVNELYELKKFVGLGTLRIMNMLVELNHKTTQKKNQELYITGKSSNVIKITVKT